MKASDFVPPPRGDFPVWLRCLSLVLLYGLVLPIAKTLELLRVRAGVIGRGPPEDIEAFRHYTPSKHDVVVCSYVKAGTTWTLQIATQIAFRGEAEFANIHHVVPWPDVPFPPMQKRMIPLGDPSPAACSPTGLRVIKTHLRKEHVPFTREARYIAVVRDPKDCCVSFYHFLKALALGPAMPSVARWVDGMFSPKFSQPWAEHLAGYWAARHEPNVLFITYEEMKRDHAGSVRKIAAFMGVDLTPDEVAKVVQLSSFAGMKAVAAKFEPGRVMPWSKDSAMLRRGTSGGSGELLTPEQQRHIDDYCRAELKRLDCDFPYDEAFSVAGGGV